MQIYNLHWKITDVATLHATMIRCRCRCRTAKCCHNKPQAVIDVHNVVNMTGNKHKASQTVSQPLCSSWVARLWRTVCVHCGFHPSWVGVNVSGVHWFCGLFAQVFTAKANTRKGCHVACNQLLPHSDKTSRQLSAYIFVRLM